MTKKIFRSFFLIPVLLSLLAIILSVTPDILRVRNAYPDTTFPLIHNNAPDYFYYLSLMRQGYDGRILLTSRMTPEGFPPVFPPTFFALLGHLPRLSGLSLYHIYFLSRI